MSKQNKILLGGFTYLGLGYLQSSLEAAGFVVESIALLGKYEFFHPTSIIRKAITPTLAKASTVYAYRDITTHIIQRLGGIQNTQQESCPEKLATVFNELLQGNLYKDKRYSKLIQGDEYIDSRNIKAINGFILHKLFASLFCDTSEYFYLQEVIKKHQPNIIGLQVLTESSALVCNMLHKIHTEFPKLQIVLGGIHATEMYEQLLCRYPFVTVIRGEGEETFVELAQALTQRESLSSIASIAFTKKNIITATPLRALVENLDSLPFPKHQLALSFGLNHLRILTSRGVTSNAVFVVWDIPHNNAYVIVQ